MNCTPHMSSILSATLAGPAIGGANLYHSHEHSLVCSSILPVAPESECFGDNLHCAVIVEVRIPFQRLKLLLTLLKMSFWI